MALYKKVNKEVRMKNGGIKYDRHKQLLTFAVFLRM